MQYVLDAALEDMGSASELTRGLGNAYYEINGLPLTFL